MGHVEYVGGVAMLLMLIVMAVIEFEFESIPHQPHVSFFDGTGPKNTTKWLLRKKRIARRTKVEAEVAPTGMFETAQLSSVDVFNKGYMHRCRGNTSKIKKIVAYDDCCQPGPGLVKEPPKVLDPCRKIQKYYVLSFGGCGSTTLAKALKGFHLHDPNPPDRMVRARTSYLRLDWDKLIPEDQIQNEQYVVIVRDPADALLSYMRRFPPRAHCEYIVRNHTHCDLLKDEDVNNGESVLGAMAKQQYDFYRMEHFYQHWKKPKRLRNYRVAFINYHRLFDKAGRDAIQEGLCVSPSVLAPFKSKSGSTVANVSSTKAAEPIIKVYDNPKRIIPLETITGLRKLYDALSTEIRGLPPISYV